MAAGHARRRCGGAAAGALLHDPGRVGVPTGIWETPGPLSEGEWERVRLHPYLTERILLRAGALEPYAATAAAHHERLDHSGYHRGCGHRDLDLAARVIAGEGGLDRDAVHAVLTAAGHVADRRAHRAHVYAKIGVSTRPGATLFAVEHGLVATTP